MIQPQNTSSSVDEILSLLKLSPEDMFVIEPSDRSGE